MTPGTRKIRAILCLQESDQGHLAHGEPVENSAGQCSCGMSALATARPRQISRASGNQEQRESSFLQAIGSESGLPSAYRKRAGANVAIRDGPTAGTCRVRELQLPLHSC